MRNIRPDAWRHFVSEMLEFAEKVGTHSDGTLPKVHWAKINADWWYEGQLMDYLKNSMKDQIDAVRPTLQAHDPDGIFTNSNLRELFRL